MMALLLLFYWVVIPVLAALAAWWLWRVASTPVTKGLVVVISAVGFLGLFWFLAGGEKWRLDQQVREMCGKDGGIKVYETVKLPAERFNQWGQPNFYKPTQRENALGPEYVFRWDLHYIRKGNPSLHRSHTQVFRRSDNKLLGEAIDYSRGGGDLPGPWQPSAFTCPEAIGHIALLTKIFVKSDKE